MNNKDINIAFIKAVNEYSNNSIEVIHENTNKDISAYPALSLYLIPNKPDSESLFNLCSKSEGIFQIMVIDESGMGNGRALTTAESIIAAFPVNRLLSNTNIKITKSYTGSGFIKDDNYNVPVSIEYQSWNQ